MQKFNQFIYLVCILFFSFFISACQDKQEEIEDEIEESEISCFSTRVNYYSKEGELVRYSHRAYNQQKNIVSDSTYEASDNSLTRTTHYEYDSQGRLIKYENNDKSSSYKSVREYTYTGESYNIKIFATFNGISYMSSQYDYKKENVITRIRIYDTEGNVSNENKYTLVDDLPVKIEQYTQGVLSLININEYDGKNLVESKTYNSDNQLSFSTKYYYESDKLVKEEYYNSNQDMTKYNIISYENNTKTKQSYDAQGNILPEKSIHKYDSYGNLTYSFSQYVEAQYSESNYTNVYNEYGFITSNISDSKQFYEGTLTYSSYRKTEYEDVQCY